MIYYFSLPPIDERMYIIFSGKDAMVIDPFISDKFLMLLKQKSICNIQLILTHEHFDHITGVNYLFKNYNTRMLCSTKCAERIQDKRKNLSSQFELFYLLNPFYKHDASYRAMCSVPFTCEPDMTFDKFLIYKWKEYTIKIWETPGHSPGSCCILLDDDHLFTGDSLVNGFKTITRYPGGDKRAFIEQTIPLLQQFAPDIMVHPGHGNCARLSHWGDLEIYRMREENTKHGN